LTEIIFLGTSGPYPSRESDNTAFLVAFGSVKCLLDCPGSVVRKMLQVGADPLEVGHLFLTHAHTDHIYGLPSLVHSLMLRRHLIRVYGSDEALETAAGLLDFFRLREDRYRTRVELVEAASGATVQPAPGLSVDFLKVPHHGSSLALSFTFAGKRIVISGDTPPCPELFEWARGADVLVHDCAGPSRFFELYPALRSRHTDALALGEWSARAGVGLLVPCHFLAELDFDREEVEREIRRNFSGDLHMPRDLERLAVG